MKYSILLVLIFFAFNSISQSSTKFYVGTFTTADSDGIYLCELNNSGDLSLKKSFKGIDNPSFLRISPERKFFMQFHARQQKSKNPVVLL